MRIVAAAVLALTITTTAWAAAPAAEPAPPAEPAPAEILPVDTDKTLRMTVDVKIDDRGPYPFIIDTGAQRSIISRDVAEALALSQGRSIRLHTMDGVETVNTVIIPRLTVNSLEVQKIEAPALLPEHIGAAGILGTDALQLHRVLVDFQAGTMALTRSAPLRKAWKDDWEGESIVVTARRKLGQLILTKASVGDTYVDVIVDTGLELSVGNEALRRKLFGQSRGAKPWRSVGLVSVTGDVTALQYTMVDQLRIAGLGIRNLPLAFTDAHVFNVLGMKNRPALLLGIDALRLFDQVSIDFVTREVGFRWSDRAKRGLPLAPAHTAAAGIKPAVPTSSGRSRACRGPGPARRCSWPDVTRAWSASPPPWRGGVRRPSRPGAWAARRPSSRTSRRWPTVPSGPGPGWRTRRT